MTIYTHEILTYDVWGNETDGWEVNDVFRTGLRVAVPVDASDSDVIRAAYGSLEFFSDAEVEEMLNTVEVDPICQHGTPSLYLRVKANERPLIELRPLSVG